MIKPYKSPKMLTPTEVAKILKVSESQFQLFVTLLPEEKSIPFKCCISIPVKKPDSWKPIEILLQGNVVNYKQ